ncbi:hypothetical protein, variant [Aphanomyces invadans]|uniref:Phospholipase B-like n=1 Tax=Aphanomyces invadans TaxID=157072 RepID=A0A024TYK5_9STRA|nr:hypothetical protein, variant [Aphanomyces invadans]ETV99103.1 hypothetical protein, variant [Aphanomyces invadans]|eukprot:XP_008872530.1 hypothetical protein, variant [Aphanomyces invadans]
MNAAEMEHVPLLGKPSPPRQWTLSHGQQHRLHRSVVHAALAVGLICLVNLGFFSSSLSFDTPSISAASSPSTSPSRRPSSFHASVTTIRVVVDRSVDGQLVASTMFDVTPTATTRHSHAVATFNDSVSQIGWSQLWVRAAPSRASNGTDDFVRAMFAAGYAEGALTHRRIHEHYWNTRSYFFGKVPTAIQLASAARVYSFLEQNIQWMRSQVASSFPRRNDTMYWSMVGGVLAQLDGLVQGYNAHRSVDDSSLSELDFLFLNADGDMQNLIARTMPAATDAATVVSLTKPSTANFKCSALVRVLPHDLLWGHATWDTYTALNKVFKHYDLPLPPRHPNDSATLRDSVAFSDDSPSHHGQNHKHDEARREPGARRRISMSSSPGYLSSVDDWYLLDSGLGVMETTNGNYNASLAATITPQSCLSWLRTKVANALAVDGPTWTTHFSAFNSGTYNNQWMVLDTSRFANGTLLAHGLTLLEQLPGDIVVGDVSAVVNAQGYWASYNIPYFEHIYNKSGIAAMASTDSSWSHQDCARAKIFRRDAPHVQSIAHLKRLMRYCLARCSHPP